MKAMLLRVGMDKGTDGHLSPIFKNKKFEYIPLSEKNIKSQEKRTFHDLIGTNGESLSHFLPKKVANRKVHYDPEFYNYTYADEGRKAKYLSKLEKGDYLVFYAGLKPYDWSGEDKLYIIGFFIIEKVLNLKETPNKIQINAQFPHNSHLKRPDLDGVVLVVGNPKKSRILDRAIELSAPKLDRIDRPYHAVSPEKASLLGIRGSIQRSIPPRFITNEENLENLKRILGL
jgi:hypothetical protein